MTVKYICCDNSGENKKLMELCKTINGLAHIHFKFTARNTPQQNDIVKRAFATLYGRIRANNNHAQLHENVRQGLWAECATLCTMLDTISTSTDKQSLYHKFYGKTSPVINKLRTFGELGIVKKTTKIQSKLVNKGDLCIFVGYPTNHASDTYRMLNLTTKWIIITHNIRWLN